MRNTLLAAIVTVGLVSSALLADNLNPPPWAGQPGTTMQQWEFLTPGLPVPGFPGAGEYLVPDIDQNIYGDATLVAYPGPLQSWQALWGGRDGVWPLSGTIEIWVPNVPQPNEYKDIWVQITWAKQVSGSTPSVLEMGDYGLQGDETYATLVDETPLDSTWFHSTYLIHLPYNPPSEWIKISGTLMVDEIVVHTICAPEPATLGLLVLGGLAALRRRSR